LATVTCPEWGPCLLGDLSLLCIDGRPQDLWEGE
jgi:hypothetical protein